MRSYRLHRFLTQIIQIILATYYLLLTTLMEGCGYTTRSALRLDLRTIAVYPFVYRIEIESPTPEYKTYYPGLEIKITKALIDRFVYDGNLRIVKREEADLILVGELIDYLRQPLRYSEFDEVEEYRLSLVVNIILKDREGNIILKEEGFIGDTTYQLIGPLAKTEAIALDEAVKDLARRIVNRIVEEW